MGVAEQNSLFDKAQHQFPVEGKFPVVVVRGPLLVALAGDKPRDQVLLKNDLFVDAPSAVHDRLVLAQSNPDQIFPRQPIFALTN